MDHAIFLDLTSALQITDDSSAATTACFEEIHWKYWVARIQVSRIMICESASFWEGQQYGQHNI